MRMRKRKNLEARLEACRCVTLNPEGIINTDQIFGNNNPVQLEIGCGKGAFTLENAKRNPDINFIAIEKERNVIVLAMEKIIREDIKNVRFICCNAENITNFFAENSIDKIYLNFSCPFPKKRYAKHRLTHKNFLDLYKTVLPAKHEVHFKTDNREFFEFSLNSFCDSNWKLQNITLDLHNSIFNENNIVTEYEEKFSSQGFPIYRLEAVNIK